MQWSYSDIMKIIQNNGMVSVIDSWLRLNLSRSDNKLWSKPKLPERLNGKP